MYGFPYVFSKYSAQCGWEPSTSVNPNSRASVHDATTRPAGTDGDHDVAEDDYPGQNWDYKYVKKMSQDVDSLPLIVGDQDHGKDRYAFYGGGHRSAAHAEAGRSHIRMWVKDDQ